MTEQDQELPSPDSEAPMSAAELLAALAREEPVFAEDIPDCLARYHEIAPALRAAVSHAATAASLPADQRILLSRGLCVLALLRDTNTCKPLLQMLRHQASRELIPPTFLLPLPEIMASVFDGDPDALFAFAADRSLQAYHRRSALETATFLTRKGTISPDSMTAFLKSFPADTTLDSELEVVGTWISAIALLGLRDLAPMVHHRMTIGPIGGLVPDRPSFDELLDRACEDPTGDEEPDLSGVREVDDISHALSHDMSVLDKYMQKRSSKRAQQDRGPSVEQVLIDLATAPWSRPEIVKTCSDRITEMTPALLSVVTSAESADTLSENRSILLCRCLYILAAARDTRIYRPLLRMLQRTEPSFHHLQKGISYRLSGVIANVFDWDTEHLLGLVADSATAPQLRVHLLDAAAYLTFKGPIPRERMQGFLSHFDVHNLTGQDQVPLIASWMRAIALLGLRDLAPLVEQRVNVADFEVSEQFYDPHDGFTAMLADAEKYPYTEERFCEQEIYGFHSAESILRQHPDEHISSTPQRIASPSPQQPRVNRPTLPAGALRKVGRNDPCPCGSGRKAKKCCLAN